MAIDNYGRQESKGGNKQQRGTYRESNIPRPEVNLFHQARVHHTLNHFQKQRHSIYGEFFLLWLFFCLQRVFWDIQMN